MLLAVSARSACIALVYSLHLTFDPNVGADDEPTRPARERVHSPRAYEQASRGRSRQLRLPCEIGLG